MRRYVLVSGVFFTLLATVQLVRFLLGWPVVVDGISIPRWLSLIAAMIVGSFAIWALRVKSRTD
ncbi:MAG TPA: hypothetical protein VF105_03705 [Gemmatimonadaceae bacterium]